MRAAFDTNAIITLCKNDKLTEKVVEYLRSHSESVMYILSEVQDELSLDKMSGKERLNYQRIEVAATRDYQKNFSIGESSIGGGDIIRGNGAVRIGIQRMVYDSKTAYENYANARKSKGLPPKDGKTWLNRNMNQADAVIFERAEELSCDYVVSDNSHILLAKNSSCQGIKLKDFIAILR